MTIETHTLCKNSIEFIEPVLRQVLPYVDIARVYCDTDSIDGTKEVLEKLSKENEKIVLKFYEAPNPIIDLVKARNIGLQDATSDWIWILDDDEYYPTLEIKKILDYLTKTDGDSIALTRWFITNKECYAPKRSHIPVDKVFRRLPNMEWRNGFGYEAIYDDKGFWGIREDPYHRTRTTQFYFLHLSYFKKYSWRNILAKSRSRYPNYKEGGTKKLPQDIIDILKTINLPTPQYFMSNKMPSQNGL